MTILPIEILPMEILPMETKGKGQAIEGGEFIH
jgi:hypothetical protein